MNKMMMDDNLLTSVGSDESQKPWEEMNQELPRRLYKSFKSMSVVFSYLE